MKAMLQQEASSENLIQYILQSKFKVTLNVVLKSFRNKVGYVKTNKYSLSGSRNSDRKIITVLKTSVRIQKNGGTMCPK